MVKKQTKVRVIEKSNGQFIITLPQEIATKWLDVKGGDRVGFEPFKGNIRIYKVE